MRSKDKKIRQSDQKSAKMMKNDYKMINKMIKMSKKSKNDLIRRWIPLLVWR